VLLTADEAAALHVGWYVDFVRSIVAP
jgi:hypothetical protein